MKKPKMFTYGFIKWLSAICFMLSFIVINVTNISAEEAEIDTSLFKYEENEDGTITITGYNGTDETVVIPSEIDGKNVSIIGEKSFYENMNIKYLTVSDGINIIDTYAFRLCENLESVILPESLSFINSLAFAGCYDLKSIKFPNTLESIGLDSFSFCTKLEKIDLPILNSLCPRAFEFCSNLKEVNCKDGLKMINLRMFSGCIKLEKVIIPDSVKIIEGYIGEITENPNTVIYANSNSYARKYANQKGIKFSCLNFHDWDNGTITLEPTVKSNGKKLFVCTACKLQKTQEISKLVLPQSGDQIIDPSTNNTYHVTNSTITNGTVKFIKTTIINSTISIPDTININGVKFRVTSVAKDAFKNNRKIKKITIGKNIKSIGSNAFSGCKNLKTIIVKSKQIQSVGKNAFKGIYKNAKIKIPKKKMKLYKSIFNKKGQKKSVKLVK